MIIDFHVHLGKDKDNTSLSLEGLKRQLIKNNIAKAVVFPFNGCDEKLINDSLQLLKLSRNNSFLIPFLRFNPKTITKEKLIALLSKNFKGIKLHPDSQFFDPIDEKFAWIYEYIEKARLPVLFHCNLKQPETNHPQKILQLARRYPKINFIIGHFFGDCFDIVKQAEKLSNIYTETSIYSRSKRIKDISLDQRFNRILFGSDFPFDDQESTLLKIRNSELPLEIQEKILYKNAEELLNLKNH